ncbi:MAG: SusC/RagA family TonB-linked outer membrane protein [Bacteroidales bacterium]|nr:SusC/RagA family TonB-linked outer membrane protein [Bacteroidales bacterium]
MKLTATLFLASLLQVSAATAYSQAAKFNFRVENKKIEDILKDIEESSNFRFFFVREQIDVERRVSIDENDATIQDLLDAIFSKDKAISYKVMEDNLVLLSAEKEKERNKLQLPLTQQQQISVSGNITDSNGQALPGVTVIVKGSPTQGTVTSIDGNYTLPNVPSGGTLLFSFVGMKPQEITINGRTTVNIAMVQDAIGMDEVIVTALGIKRDAKSIGYAATQVNTDEISNPAMVNLGNNLQGKIAGVNVDALASGAGGSSKIRIRGQSSFSANNEPLIVVNGIPINNTPITSQNANAQQSDLGDGLQSINPDDIESMTVLKGASAAALYGYRAKDGVIIITTKTGTAKTGLGIEFTTSFTAERALDFTDLQYEYGQGENGIRPASIADARSSGGWSFGTKFDGEPVWSIDGKQHPYVPFKDRINSFYDTGTNITNALALSGASENGSYRFSFANTDADNITPNSTFSRKIFGTALNYQLGPKLTAQINANYSLEYNKNAPFGGQQFSIPNSIMSMANSIDPRWMRDSYKDPETGNEIGFMRFADRTNWYWSAYERLDDNERERIYGNIMLRYDITPWLYMQGRVGQDKFSRHSELITPTGTAFLGPVQTGFNGSFRQGKNNFSEINMDFLVGANKTFGDFGFDATFGGNRMDQSSENLSTTVNNFYVRGLYAIGNGQIKNPTYTHSGKKINSLYGSLNLSYKDVLFLNATGRNDWFSTLNPDSNSYFYPSVSGSFLFSQAFEGVMPQWVNYGKLRASYAEVGGDTDPYRDNLYYSMNAIPYNEYAYGGISSNTMPNAYLKPLNIQETEAGIELILFNNRVNIDFAAYRKNTLEEILTVDISNASGYSTTIVNIGKIRNQGIETLFRVVPVRTSNFSWETGINYTYNISKVLNLANDQTIINVGSSTFIGRLSHEVGKPLASLRGYDYLRNDNGEIITINGRFQRGEEITYGSAIPKHIGGLLNTFTYKKLRVFAQIDFKAGHKLISDTNWNMLRSGHHKKSLPGREGGVIFDGVNLDGTPNTTPVPAQTFYTDYSARSITTEAVYDASFVRWRTLSIGYDLSSLFNNAFIKSCVVNANVNNVLMIKKFTENIDPEAASQVSDNSVGLESVSLPTTRSYSLSFNFKF